MLYVCCCCEMREACGGRKKSGSPTCAPRSLSVRPPFFSASPRGVACSPPSKRVACSRSYMLTCSHPSLSVPRIFFFFFLLGTLLRSALRLGLGTSCRASRADRVVRDTTRCTGTKKGACRRVCATWRLLPLRATASAESLIAEPTRDQKRDTENEDYSGSTLSHILNTPKLPLSLSLGSQLFIATSNPSPSTCLVSAGAITPSSQRRAEAYSGVDSCSI